MAATFAICVPVDLLFYGNDINQMIISYITTSKMWCGRKSTIIADKDFKNTQLAISKGSFALKSCIQPLIIEKQMFVLRFLAAWDTLNN